MKTGTALFFMSLICLSASSDLLKIGAFMVHREAIIQRSCVNLNQPEKKCRGKCALSAQLAGQSQQDPVLPLPEPDSKSLFTLGVEFASQNLVSTGALPLMETVLVLTTRLVIVDLGKPPEILEIRNN